MDARINEISHDVSSGAQAPAPDAAGSSMAAIPSAVALPCELAFWALWHCRHARPPDVAYSR
ncbi:hypothetical protein [Pseudomonas vanderleydeniana]|uniref:Uncharacterized protein n=1 Tax=Pseudomonas vanderleydeniana TaxID=2745495 RepID=A0A9E6PND1_9PSED|nr:hypothetical protein [Pseudomonas vanderleydeniana]QXI29977.1 hypothetical protein HU752_008505 [Pseudomonas vanderleydeniana]